MNNNDEKYKKFFYNTENLENVYNILKGDEKQLKKETVKKLIQDFEGVEYDEINDNNISSNVNFKINNSNNDDVSNNNDSNYDEKNSSDYISFEEFCSIFKKIYENSRNPEKIFLEGYCYMDKDK
jgi:hypothetical protein